MSEFKFEKSETWTTKVYAGRKQTAMVQIKHWTRPTYEALIAGSGDVAHMWNVYATIWPDHHLFDRASKVTENDYIGSGLCLPFHGGQTYHRRYHNEIGEVVAVEMGCDYAHYGDDRFESYATLSDAASVEMDARELVLALQESA